MTPLKIGIMSFAHVHAAFYLERLVDRTDVDIMTADPHGAEAQDPGPRGRDFANRYGAGYVDTYEELFAWAPDAVVICTENSRHLEAMRLAAAAGVHVLCEKPLATTVDDAEEMVRLAERAGVFLMTAFPVRFSPAFVSMCERIARGDLGEVLAVLGTNNGKIPAGDRAWFTDPELAGGGALVDHVVHCADLIDVLLDGQLPSTVHAAANAILHEGASVETGGLVSMRYPNGLVATVDCSWSQPDNAVLWGDVGLVVTGTKGTLTFDGFARSILGTDRAGGVWIPTGFDMDGAMLDHFLNSVRTGVGPQPDGRTGLRMTRIMQAAQESALTGDPVPLMAAR